MKQKISLTDREKAILRHLAEGCNDKETAIKIGFSYGSVRRCVFGLFTKTGSSNKTALVAWAFRNGAIK